MPKVISCSIMPPDENNLSPHLPLICQLAVSVSADTHRSSRHGADSSRRCDILDWDCAEKNEVYRKILAESLSDTLPECDGSLNSLDSAISRCIHGAARAAGCSKPRLPPRSWWTPSTAAARDRARFWRRLWICCGRPSAAVVADCYSEARRSYRRARRKVHGAAPYCLCGQPSADRDRQGRQVGTIAGAGVTSAGNERLLEANQLAAFEPVLSVGLDPERSVLRRLGQRPTPKLLACLEQFQGAGCFLALLAGNR